MRNMSIHTMLKRYLIIATTVPILFFGLYLYTNVKNTYRDTYESNLRQAYFLIEQHIDLFNQKNEDLIELFLSETIILDVFKKDENLKSNEELLASEIKTYDSIFEYGGSIAIGLSDGRMYSENTYKLPKDYDPRVRPWYKDAIAANGNIVLSDPYPNAIDEDTFSITYSKAIINPDDNAIIGVIGVDVSLDELITLDRNMNLPADSFVQILDDSNNIISENLSKSYYNLEDYNFKEWIYVKNRWKIVIYTPNSIFRKTQVQILFPTMIIVIFMFLCSFVYAKFIDKKLMKPLDDIRFQLNHLNIENDCEEQILINDSLKDTIETEIIRNSINSLLARIYEQRSNIFKNKEEINRQYMEIEALYEETSAMNETLNDMFENMNESYKETVKVLSNAIEANDEYTKGHCDRVTEYSMKIAERMGFSEEEKKQLEFAAILHDIGKISVSQNILNKEETLIKAEWDIMKKHPFVGYGIIKDVFFLREASLGVKNHHEKFDGSGYPDGLKKDEIPIIARIISVADAYDAMTTVRAYRKTPLTKKEAIKELRENSGKQFDPEIIEIFLDILDIMN